MVWALTGLILTLSAPPPVASFTVTSPAYVGQTVQYTDQSFDPDPGHVIVLRIWIGRASSFGSAGSYPVTLEVEDDRGLWGSVTHDVVILPQGTVGGGGSGGGGGGRTDGAALQCSPCTAMRGDPLTLRLTAPRDASGISLELPSAFRREVVLPSGTIDYSRINAAKWRWSDGVLTATVWVPWTRSAPANGTYRISAVFRAGARRIVASCRLRVLGTDRILTWLLAAPP